MIYGAVCFRRGLYGACCFPGGVWLPWEFSNGRAAADSPSSDVSDTKQAFMSEILHKYCRNIEYHYQVYYASKLE